MKSESQHEKIQILKASGVMAAFTMLSRVLGLVRNLILSHFFGASLVADAFIAAFTIPNALRRLFGEGALTPAIVSIFTRVRTDRPSPAESQRFVTASFWWLTATISLVMLIGILFAPWLVRLYVPEFSEIEGKLELTTSLTRFLFPFILFLGWAALFMGILNTLRIFAVSAFAPTMLNITVIVAVPATLWWLKPEPLQGIFIFASAILLGGFLQAAIHWPALWKAKTEPQILTPRFDDPQIAELKRLMLPSLLAMGTYQLNIIVNRVFASGIEGAVSHLFYADLLLELPVSLIAVSLGTAVLPTFSRFAAEDNRKALGETFRFSLENALFFALPAAAGLMGLAIPLCSTLYFSGKFTAHDLDQTSQCLMAYAIGLPFFVALRIYTPIFFAFKNTRTPTIVGVIALIVNFVAAWQLSLRWGAWGVALATAISSWVNVKILGTIIFFQLREFEWLRIAQNTLRMLAGAAIVGLSLWKASDFFGQELWHTSGLSVQKLTATTSLLLLGVLTYGLVTLILGLPQSKQILRRISRLGQSR